MTKYHGASKYELRHNVKPKIAPLAAAVSGALAAGSLQAATITVSTLDDGLPNDQCSLRSALYASTLNVAYDACVAGEAGQDEIVFDSSLSGTIALEESAGLDLYYDGSTLPIGESVAIFGDNRITIDGTSGGPIFYGKYNYDPGYYAELVELHGLTIFGSAADKGGGVLSRGDRLEIHDSSFVSNLANEAGGAIWHEPTTGSGELRIYDSEFLYNSVQSTSGKAPAVGVSMSYGTGVYVYGSTFDTNQSGGEVAGGGAIHLDIGDPGAIIQVDDCSFVNNLANNDGGAIWAQLEYSIFNVNNSTFTDNTANGRGGAVHLAENQGAPYQRAEVTFQNNGFYGNYAGDNGGALDVTITNGDDGSVDPPVKFVDITGQNVFDDNRAGAGSGFGSGGAVYLRLEDAVPATISGAQFDDNQADGSGGAVMIAAQASEVSVGNSLFSGNTAATEGGGLYVGSGNSAVYAAGLEMQFNIADGAGGGGMKVVAQDSEIGVTDSLFAFNNANACGGGLYVTNEPSDVNLGYLEVYGNDALCGGGVALWVPNAGSALIDVKYSEFSGNTASDASTGSGSGGGGVFVEGGSGTSFVIKNSTLSGNESVGIGGGMTLEGGVVAQIKYSTIAGNTADSGGGLYNRLADCSIDNAIFGGNEGSSGGLEDVRGPEDCSISYSLLAGASASDFSDDGGNILDQDPLLGPLADNGGAGGFTRALQPGSPAIDAGNAGTNLPDYDQRGAGFPRTSGAGLDMGAYEFDSAADDKIFSDRFEQP